MTLFCLYCSSRDNFVVCCVMSPLGNLRCRRLPRIQAGVLLTGLLVSAVVGQPSVERRFAARVSQTQLQRVVRQLVSFGNRLGGTASGDRSAAYIQKALRSFGLKTTIVADEQHLTYTNERWTLGVQEPDRLRGLVQNAALAGFSPTVSTQTCRVVLLSPKDDVARRLVDGAAVVYDGEVSDELCEDLAKAGARALLLYHSLPSGAYAQWAMISTLSASEKNPLPVFNIPNSVGVRLRDEVRKGTSLKVRFNTRTNIRMGRPKTVIASIPGTTGQYYIVCAHGDADSGGPGADDNASGVAGVLELARTFQEMIRNRVLSRPAVGLRFIVWGSEGHSTECYVTRHADGLDSIAGVINFDEIGFGKTRDCLYVEGNDYDVNRPLLTVFQSVLEMYAGRSGFWREATTNPSQGGTDSYVFLPRGLRRLGVRSVDIPSVTVFTAAWNVPRSLLQTRGWLSKAWKGHPDSVSIDYSPYYHSTLDIPRLTTDKEPFNMVWAVKASGIALLRLAWK